MNYIYDDGVKIIIQKWWTLQSLVMQTVSTHALPSDCPNAYGGEETARDDHPAPSAFWWVCDPPASFKPFFRDNCHRSRDLQLLFFWIWRRMIFHCLVLFRCNWSCLLKDLHVPPPSFWTLQTILTFWAT